MSNPFTQTLTAAISKKQTVTVRYKDQDRKLEPHAIGRNTQGIEFLRAYQPQELADSKSGWKLLRVDRMQSVSSTEGDTFEGPRPGYKKGDSAMPAEIYAEL